MAIPQEELAALTAELVAIDSTNPDLVPGGAGEAEIARFVAGWLERACHARHRGRGDGRAGHGGGALRARLAGA